MAYELRAPQFDLSGSLASAIDAAATAITGKGSLFTSLRTDLSTGLYIPLTLADDGLGKSEIVWATSHASASPTIGVIRGREGTAPLQFDAGAIIRCSPTIRDVEGLWANRAALPADPHVGMRAALQDEVITVERTLTGWDDSAPLKADTGRRHHWQQTGAALPVVGAGQIIVGLSGNQTGTAGAIASCSGGQLSLNKAGLWTVKLSGFGPSRTGSNMNFGVGMKWPGGAFLSTPYQVVGQAASANTLVECVFTGYVTAAQAAQPIELDGFTNVAYASGCQWDVTAEYLGG